jgi:hypothetical protein
MYQPYGRPLPPGPGRNRTGFSPVAGQVNGQRMIPTPGTATPPSPAQDFSRAGAMSRLQGAYNPLQPAAPSSPVSSGMGQASSGAPMQGGTPIAPTASRMGQTQDLPQQGGGAVTPSPLPQFSPGWTFKGGAQGGGSMKGTPQGKPYSGQMDQAAPATPPVAPKPRIISRYPQLPGSF